MPAEELVVLIEEPIVPTQGSVLTYSSPPNPNPTGNGQQVVPHPIVSDALSSTPPLSENSFASKVVEFADTNTLLPSSSSTLNVELVPSASLPCDSSVDTHSIQPLNSVANTHPMQTRGKAGIRKPKVYIAHLELVPSTVHEAMQHT
ncbi:hypothetical protein V6N12_064922 [Hibiscus sabdariffa]|uniref:Uncharacterized protein n=1 Tax=Hibiscus sabdariffa TaxID=183260 RepID=A0ABR2G7Q8_9ROSI